MESESEKKSRQKGKKKSQVADVGVINKIIDNIPVEIHVPTYQYSGPGTRVEERVARGDPGKNPLDAAARDHDLAYAENQNRRIADKKLAEYAFSRILADDSEAEEKAAALLTVCCMFGKISFE